MEISSTDKAKYFKGLITISINRKIISRKRRDNFEHLCELFKYRKDLCEKELEYALNNQFTIPKPPVFDSKLVANYFVEDVIKLSFADKTLHLFELNWIKFFTDLNGSDKNECLQMIFDYIAEKPIPIDFSDLNINKILDN